MRAREAEPLEARLDFGDAHEKLPQKPAAVILDHDDDRTLIDRQIRIGIPVAAFIEGIDEANVELVWDPPWNQGMMTDAAKLQLGLM